MREPRFWAADLDPYSRESAPVTRALLTPLSWLYAAATAHKLANTKPFQASIPVICVGNLTAGGVGKSPVVEALRKRLTDLTDQRVATLSRGYGGSEKGPIRVDVDTHTARQVGDEPLMLAHSGESWIGADRAEAAAAMVEAGVQMVLMDDGHQNPGLFKDVSLIVVDSRMRFGNGYIIPKGPLREPIDKGLARADAVILMGDGPIPDELSSFTGPILRASVKPCAPAPSGPLVAFAGIGRPEKFFDSLKATGGDLCDAVPFPDHHNYRPNDLKWLRRLADDHSAQLITTEKDYARLSDRERSDMLTFPVEAVFEDAHKLDDLILPLLKPA
ncbi:MAG: tetraacyldisaccharide 4'-kinase [Pseudomonadota bacterium]